MITRTPIKVKTLKSTLTLKSTSTSKINPNSILFLSMRSKHLMITAKENKHIQHAVDPKDETFKLIPSLSMSRKHFKISGEKNKHANVPPPIRLSS